MVRVSLDPSPPKTREEARRFKPLRYAEHRTTLSQPWVVVTIRTVCVKQRRIDGHELCGTARENGKRRACTRKHSGCERERNTRLHDVACGHPDETNAAAPEPGLVRLIRHGSYRIAWLPD